MELLIHTFNESQVIMLREKRAWFKMWNTVWLHLCGAQKDKTLEMKTGLTRARSRGQVSLYEGISWGWRKCFVSWLWCELHESIYTSKFIEQKTAKSPFYCRLIFKIKMHSKVSLLLRRCSLGSIPLLWSNNPAVGPLNRVFEFPSKKLELVLENHSK